MESALFALLAAGATHDEILSDFPALKEEDIRAALSFAAEELDQPARAFA
jgi:uncharacterized protein (DUF433 family)